MDSIPFAFSVHHFISSVGADVGFASIIGLAILVLLYFAQARETATLREQAYEASQRVQQLEGRLAQLSRQQAAGAARSPEPAPRPMVAVPGVAGAAATAAAGNASAGAGSPGRPPLPVPAHAAARSTAVGAPAGVAAPALADATKLIPTPVAAGVQTAAPATPDPPTVGEAGTPPPATAAGGANGAGQERAMPAPPPRQRPIQPRAQGRPRTAASAERRPATTQRASTTRVYGGRRRRWPLLLGALATAAIVAALLIVTSGGGRTATKSATATTNAPTARRPRTRARFNPSSVTVAVLNGTATSGLAHMIATRLSGSGYREGAVATASDQTQTATVVGYMSGYKRDALAVASTLKLAPGSVQPVDQSAQAVACPQPSACNAMVIVTVGSDLASQ